MENEQLNHLFEAYLAKTCTGKEKQQLAEIILEYQHNEELDILMQQAWENTTADADMVPQKASQIMEAILQGKTSYEVKQQQAGKLLKLYPVSRWRKMIAAAAVLILLAGGGYFFFANKKADTANMAVVNTDNIKAPENSKASIILANGQSVLLDSIHNGILAMQGNMQVMKTAGGEIIYSGSSSQMQYNTLVNPRGSTVANLTLSDGTKVWLNSESSLTYPIAFTGTERKVEITGEAYFEVAKKPGKKFIVTSGTVQTEVLGTHFNVNAYADENNIKVTLLEGSVKVTKATASGLLIPGQQADISESIKVINEVDVDGVIAWKNGQFILKGTNMAALMRQVARWYNVDVVYEGKIPEKKFGGTISRNVNLSAMLQALHENGIIYDIKDGKVIIK